MKILLTVPMSRPPSPDDVEPMNDNGLGYIASTCKDAGAEVDLLSWNVNLDFDSFRNILLEKQPDMIGIKVFTSHFNPAYKTLQIIKETLPNSLTIIGGPHPSTSKPKDIFYEFNKILDFAIAGDGEEGISALIKQIQIAGGKPKTEVLKNIPGLIYQDGNEVKSNKPYFDANLENLSPQDWSLQHPNIFKIDKVLILDSRGCPARCGHCMCWNINGSKPRKRNLKILWEEIKELINNYGVRYIDFTGNAFLSDVEYVEELCHKIIEFGVPIQWNCTGAAFDLNLRKPKLLDLMKKSGCNAIHFGIETGNPNVLAKLCKPLSLEEYDEVVTLTAAAGIQALGYFMFCFPDETDEEMEDTIKYALSLPFHSIFFGICQPFPGTSSYNAILRQQGIERIKWKDYDFKNPKILPCKVSLKKVKHKLFKMKVLRKFSIARSLYRYYNNIKIR